MDPQVTHCPKNFAYALCLLNFRHLRGEKCSPLSLPKRFLGSARVSVLCFMCGVFCARSSPAMLQTTFGLPLGFQTGGNAVHFLCTYFLFALVLLLSLIPPPHPRRPAVLFTTRQSKNQNKQKALTKFSVRAKAPHM